MKVLTRKLSEIRVRPAFEGEKIVLNYETKLVYKKKNFWLVLMRPLLAGFNAPIDIVH
jgi:hypothetical protein